MQNFMVCANALNINGSLAESGEKPGKIRLLPQNFMVEACTIPDQLVGLFAKPEGEENCEPLVFIGLVDAILHSPNSAVRPE